MAQAHDDVKSKEDDDDLNNKNGFNQIENSIVNTEPGVMWSIGWNREGQHGNGTENNVKQLTLHKWAKNLDIVKVVSGHDFCSYICNDGSLWVCGKNDCGQLGLGHLNDVTAATKNTYFGERNLVLRDIACGPYGAHQIALTSNGQVYGTGRNSSYELGQSDKSNRTEFKQLSFFEDNALKVKQVACSASYSLFLTIDGGVYVCGSSEYGGLGSGPEGTEVQSGIRKLEAFNGKLMRQIACGKGHSLSIDEDGRVWSWGKNSYGERGLGHTKDDKSLPSIIPYFARNGIKTVKVSCGQHHNLSLDAVHKVYTWGRNNSCSCGDGTRSNVLVPKVVSALKNRHIVDVQTFRDHNVAIPTKFNHQTKVTIANTVVLSIQPGNHATNVIVARHPQAYARKKIHESTRYISMVPPKILQQLLRDQIHETHRLMEEKKVVNQQLEELETDHKSQKKEIESMSKEMKKLNETIEEQENMEQSLKEQLERTKKESKDRESDIEGMSKEIEGHQKSLKAQQKQIQSKNREIDGLQKEAVAQQQQFRSLQEKLQTQEQQNVSMVQQMNQLKEKVQSQDKENKSVTKQLEGLQTDVQDRDKNIDKFKKQIESQQKAHDVQAKQNQSKTQQIVRLQDQIQVQDQKEQTLRQTLRNREEEKTSMVQTLQQLQEDAKRRTDDIKRLNAEIVENRKALQQQAVTQNALRNREEELKRCQIDGEGQALRIKTLQERVQAVEQENQSLERQQEGFKQTIRHQTEDISRIKEEIAEQTRELNQKKQDIQSITIELEGSRADGEAKLTRIESLEERVQQEAKEKQSVNRKMEEFRRKLQERDIEVGKMRAEFNEQQQRLANQKNEIQILNDEKETLRKTLRIQEEQIESKSRGIDRLQNKANAQKQQFRSLQEKIQTQEKENKSVTKQLKGMQNDIQDRDENIEKMKKEIKSQQKAYKAQEKEIQSKTQQIGRLQERLQVKDQEEQTLRQTLQNREEQNTSMMQQLQRLQQDAELRTANINRLNAEIAENQRKFRQEEEEKSFIINQLERARDEGVAKDQKIEAFEERLRRSYTLSVVHDEKTQMDDKGDEIESSEHERTHGDGALYKKHYDIITEWNILTEKLKKLTEPTKRGDDDEKEPDEQQQGGLSVDNLLAEYENAYRLINQQKARLKQVKDTNLSELILHQNELSVKYLFAIRIVRILSVYSNLSIRSQESVKKLEAELSSKKEEFVQKNERYKKIKVSRQAIVSMIKKTVNQCNQLIDSENKLSAELKVLNKGTDAVKVQLETAKSSSADCADTISLYAVFGEQNEKHLDMISNHYSEEWEAFESRCFEWSAHELVVHFRRIAASVVVDDQESISESQDDEEQSLVSILSFLFFSLCSTSFIRA